MRLNTTTQFPAPVAVEWTELEAAGAMKDGTALFRGAMRENGTEAHNVTKGNNPDTPRSRSSVLIASNGADPARGDDHEPLTKRETFRGVDAAMSTRRHHRLSYCQPTRMRDDPL
jgi:hypothetical protein